MIRQGQEKLKELEELMNGTGYFTEGFNVGIGDFVEHDLEGQPTVPNGGGPPIDNGNGPDDPAPQRAKKEAFPSIEGPGTCAEIVNRYKKAILSRQAAWRDVNEKWIAAAPKSGMLLDYLISVTFLLCGIGFCLALLFAILPSVAMGPCHSGLSGLPWKARMVTGRILFTFTTWPLQAEMCHFQRRFFTTKTGSSILCFVCEFLRPSGKLAGLYKDICAKEQVQSETNPECKSVFAQVCSQIKQTCTQFGNEMQAVKVHLPKAAAKSRAKKANPVETKQEED